MRRLLPLVAVFTSGCALVALTTRERSEPRVDGEVEVAGLRLPASIVRDSYGIPHIRAASDADAVFALGFVHAQDRLFQADLTRRAAWGTLSEVLGERTVDYDLFVKGLGLRRRAERDVERASPEVRKLIVAYTEGMNAGIASLKADPVEYRVLGERPAEWTAADCLAVLYLNAWGLSENLETEAFALATRLPGDTLDDLFAYDPETPKIDLYWDDLRGVDVGALTPGGRLFTGVDTLGRDPQASNNWVIGPTRSAAGAPIVANDPHLLQRVPSLWYAADLRGGSLSVTGVTLPGAPQVVIGHNAHVGWGLTNVMGDTVDLAVLERAGDWGYVLAGEPHVLQRVPVDVVVRGKGTVRGEALWTDVGPVLTELTGTHLVALRWAALETDDESADLFFGLARAATVDDALRAVDRPSIVSQNLVVADDAGHFAWQQFGALVRRKGFTGRVPYPASDPALGWQGWLDGLPGERDPARGTVHSANARPDHPVADAISTAYAPSIRHERIAALLDARPTWAVDDVVAMQGDRYDLLAARAVPELLTGVVPSTPEAQTCHRVLGSWDFVADPDAIGPSVWAVFHRELLEKALIDELGARGLALYLDTVGAGRSLLMGRLDAFQQDRVAEVDRALHDTCARLAGTHGADPAGWTWGALHPLALKHPFGGRLDSFNLPSVPFGGTGTTVWTASFRLGAPPDGELPVGTVASMQIVMPLDDLDGTLLAYPGGQSGHPTSEHYADLLPGYVAGDRIPLHSRDEAVSADAVHTLRLIPASSW